MVRRITLFAERAEFAGVQVDRQSRQLILKWSAETEVRNVTYMCLVIFRLGWPPLRWIRAFVGNGR